MAADCEGTCSEPSAVVQLALCSFLLEEVEQRLVLSLRGHNDDVAEVLGCGSDEADAADVYLLDDVCLACPRCHGVLEGIEIDDDEVDVRNVVLLHLLPVAFVLATSEDAAEHLRVQRLDSAAQDAGVGRYVLHFAARNAETLDECLGAARREEFDSFLMKGAQYVLQPVLVEDGNQCPLDLSCFSHVVECVVAVNT